MIIDKKTGKAKLEELDINVDGYKDSKRLREAKESYNSDKEMKTECRGEDWPIDMWYYLFRKYYSGLKSWKEFIKRNRKNNEK